MPRHLEFGFWPVLLAASSEVQKDLHDSQSADKPIAGPMLVVAGEDDRVVAFDSLARSVRHAGALDLPVEFWHPAGVDHDPLLQQSTPELPAWARARLDRVPWSGNCPTTAGSR